MKAEMEKRQEKSGVHQGDESRNGEEEREKWCSSRG